MRLLLKILSLPLLVVTGMLYGFLQIPCSCVRGRTRRSVGNRLSDSHRDLFRCGPVGRSCLAVDRVSDQPIRIAAVGGLGRGIAWQRP